MSPLPTVTELLPFLAQVALRTSLLLLALLVADLLLPRRWAAWRSLLWRAGLVAALLLPVLMPVLPRLVVPFPAANLMPAAESSALPSLPTSSGSPAVQPATPVSAAHDPGLAPWTHLLLGGYAAGLTAALMVLLVGWWRTTRQAGSAPAIGDGTWDHVLATYRRRLGIQRQVRLGTGALSVPVQIGIVRPRILLPAEMVAEADPALLRTAIVHELIHVRRLDFAFNLVAGLALSLYWCNPLVWLAVRRLRDSAEQACDDWSVELLGQPERYGSCLLEVAARCGRRPRLSLSAGMARRPRVAARIERIAALAGNVSPRVGWRAGSGFTVALALASCLLAACVGNRSYAAPLRPAAEQAEGMTVADDGSVSFTEWWRKPQWHLEVSLRPVTAEELSRQFPTQSQGAFQDLTVFRLGVANYVYPKVRIDPASIVLRSADGREWRSLVPALFLDQYGPRKDSNEVFSGQEASGYLVFKALDSDVRDIQVTVQDVVVRFDYRNEPVQTMDLTYRFVR